MLDDPAPAPIPFHDAWLRCTRPENWTKRAAKARSPGEVHRKDRMARWGAGAVDDSVRPSSVLGQAPCPLGLATCGTTWAERVRTLPLGSR